MSDPLIGQTLGGKYKILELLGHGGMANVYKAYQEGKQRHVAVKVMHSFLVHEQDFLPRFKREAKAMALLKHPRIVKIYDFNATASKTYYLVMQYINGGTLKQRLETTTASGKYLPTKDIVHVGAQIADAIAYAHFNGIVHRDIKSGNIMLDEQGKVYLTDFGIVKMIGGQSSMIYTTTGALIGSPAYMSPEQALGKPGDERSDIYSLGVLLFQIATSKLPFESDTALGVVLKHVNEQPPNPSQINSNIGSNLQGIILKAMAKKPEDRFQSATAIVEALRSINATPAKPDLVPAEPEPILLEKSAPQTAVSSPTPTPPPSPLLPQEVIDIPARPYAHPPWLKETEIICPNCEAAIDVSNHSERVTCHKCQHQYKLAGHMCPYCHTYHKKESTFCRECGEMMVRVCHNCRTPNWGGDDNCKNCDTPLDLLELLQSRTKNTSNQSLEAEIDLARQKREEEHQARIEQTQAIYTRKQQQRKQTRRRRLRQTLQEILFFILALASIATIAYYAFNWLS